MLASSENSHELNPVLNPIALNKQPIKPQDTIQYQQQQQLEHSSKTIQKPISLDAYRVLLMNRQTTNGTSPVDSQTKQNPLIHVASEPMIRRIVESAAMMRLNSGDLLPVPDQFTPPPSPPSPSSPSPDRFNEYQLKRTLNTPNNPTSVRPPRHFDFVVYGILPNNTVIRKSPNDIYPNAEASADTATATGPSFAYGILPNSTVLRRYANGTTTIDMTWLHAQRRGRYEITDIDPMHLLDPTSVIYRRLPPMTLSHQPNVAGLPVPDSASHLAVEPAGRPTINSENNLANGTLAAGSMVFQLPPSIPILRTLCIPALSTYQNEIARFASFLPLFAAYVLYTRICSVKLGSHFLCISVVSLSIYSYGGHLDWNELSTVFRGNVAMACHALIKFKRCCGNDRE